MSENDNADVVKREDYNKLVESTNSLKIEKEKMENELKKLKGDSERKEIEDRERAKWDEEFKKRDEAINELKKKVEANQVPVRKGVVPTNIVPQTPQEEPIELLNKILPNRKKVPEKFASNLARYGYYKSPSTKEYTDEQFGMALSLKASAFKLDPSMIPSESRKSREDIIFT